MGYSHYYYTPKKFSKVEFKAFTKDVKAIFDYSQNVLGIQLANGHGTSGSEPIIDTEEKVISFNGSETQPIGVWTTSEHISIPWPSDDAGLTDMIVDPIAPKVSGEWFAGSIISQRVAPIGSETGLGSGSYETLYIGDGDREVNKDNGLCFNCCKTAYRPYDLVVTAVLIALRYHFPQCEISSDGDDKDWLDGKILCNNLLGYGLDFQLNVPEPED